MSPVPVAAGTASPLSHHPTFTRFSGIVHRPRATFRAVAAAPAWVSLLVLLTVLTGSARAVLMQTAVGQQALVDQWERTALAFGQEVDDVRYAQFQDLSRRGAVYGVATALLEGPVLAAVLATTIFAVFGRLQGGRASFQQVLAVVVHASVILALRQLVAAPVAYARESTASATSLGVWFSGFDEASPIARFLGALDLFVIWWLVVLAIGVAVLYGRRARTLGTGFLAIYGILALVMAGIMAVLGQ